jgi:hypothetical protein
MVIFKIMDRLKMLMNNKINNSLNKIKIKKTNFKIKIKMKMYYNKMIKLMIKTKITTYHNFQDQYHPKLLMVNLKQKDKKVN